MPGAGAWPTATFFGEAPFELLRASATVGEQLASGLDNARDGCLVVTGEAVERVCGMVREGHGTVAHDSTG